MANIVQRITLQGADQIKAALASIGTTGAAAFAKLQEVRQLDSSFKTFAGTVVETSKNMQKFGEASATAIKESAAFGGALGSSLLKVTGLTAGLGIAVKKVVDQFKQVGSETEELQQNADAVGLTAEEYEKLRNALAQNGLGAEEAARVLDRLTKFIKSAAEQTDDYNKKQKALLTQLQTGKITWAEYQKQLKDLQDGMGSAAKIADRYNLRLRNQDGSLRNIREALLGLAAGMNEADDKTQAAADGLEVFGRGGRKITQVLGQGKEALEKLEQAMGLLAPTAAKGVLESITKMDDAFDNLGIFAKALKRDIVGVFAPDVTRLVSTFTNVLANNRPRFLELLQVIRGELQPAIDSLLAALNSPEAGDVLLRFFRGAVDAAKAFGKAITEIIIPAFQGILKYANDLAEVINKAFGTELTGGVLLAGLAVAKFSGALNVLITAVTAAGAIINVFIAVIRVAIPLLRLFWLALLTPAGAIIALGIAIGTLVGLVIRYWPQIVAATKAAWDVVVAYTKQKWIEAGLAVFNFFERIRTFFTNDIPAFFKTVWDGIVAYAQTKWDELAAYIGGKVEQVKGLWNSIIQFFIDLWNGVVKLATDAWNLVKEGAVALFDYLTNAPGAAFNAIKNAARDMYESVKGWFLDLIEKAKTFLGLQSQAKAGSSDSGGATPGHARGGRINGPGSGTSDSIMARLSNGEWVIKAAAVRHYGNGFMAMLNNMQLPKFAEGGAVRIAQSFIPELPAMPRFAMGGPVADGGRPMTLQIGDQLIPGLTATPSAVRQMQKFAAAKSVSSAGRKPLWFKG